MTTYLSQSRAKRSGFTLVELLVAITVIGILVGMLTAAVIPVLRTARATAITLEMRQLDQQLEQFQVDNGFYPPVISNVSVAQLQRYVNLMAPNNEERTDSGHNNESRLEHWHEEIGQFLDQESSLVFWLSGTFKNKQYPITSGWTGTNRDLPAHAYGNVNPSERNIYYDFRSGQLFGDDPAEVVQDSNGAALPNALQGVILEYRQAHGPKKKDLLFKYRDAATSYGGAFPAYHVLDENGNPNFLNPNSFQLISFGMDGEPGPTGNAFRAGDDSRGEDNICNFADGRLKRWSLANQ